MARGHRACHRAGYSNRHPLCRPAVRIRTGSARWRTRCGPDVSGSSPVAHLLGCGTLEGLLPRGQPLHASSGAHPARHRRRPPSTGSNGAPGRVSCHSDTHLAGPPPRSGNCHWLDRRRSFWSRHILQRVALSSRRRLLWHRTSGDVVQESSGRSVLLTAAPVAREAHTIVLDTAPPPSGLSSRPSRSAERGRASCPPHRGPRATARQRTAVGRLENCCWSLGHCLTALRQPNSSGPPSI